MLTLFPLLHVDSTVSRYPLDVASELQRTDRQEFSHTVINAFGLQVPRARVYEDLINLKGIDDVQILSEVGNCQTSDHMIRKLNRINCRYCVFQLL